jgi:endonuclease YncB( thermonuclease family)
MQRTPKICALAAFGIFLSAAPAASADSSVSRYEPKAAPEPSPLRVEVIDGVRFRDIESKAIYRLFGVDVCAPGQTATLGRQAWPCGTMATAWLVKATLNAWLACVTIRKNGDEQVARCSTARHPDLAAAMLEDGVAVLAPATSAEAPVAAYAAAEAQARKSFRGLWASAFEMPWDWRARHGAGSFARDERERAP